MFEKYLKIEKVINKITIYICYISFYGMLAIMLLNVADVFMAKFFSPIIGTYEITSRLLLCTVFAAFAYTQTQKKHITMTLIVSRFPRPLRFTMFSLMGYLSFIISALLTYAAFYQCDVARVGGTTTDILFIPLYPFFFVQAIAMAALTVTLAFDAVLSSIAIVRKDFADHVSSSWE